MVISQLFKEFDQSERAGGIVLIFCTVVSLVLANSGFGESYSGFWHKEIAGLSLEHWINDGLMTIFFLLIGLELEREIYIGELSDLKNAILPISAALGGMIFPAFIYLIFNFGTDTSSGSGIPTATDIAFSLGILSLLGKSVPTSLKIFLTALAVADDLGAIIIIAIFYSKSVILLNLILSLSVFGLLLLIKFFKVCNLIPYLIGGIAMWYFMLHSGIHPTITGVLLAFAIPFAKGGEHSPSYILQHILHNPVAFIVMPVFALANTAIILSSNWYESFSEPYSLGILAGLTIGKPLGITLVSLIAVKMGLAVLPEDVSWKQIIGTGFLAGIGFTMSIFITLLAFDNTLIINNAKAVIIVASFISGLIGFLFLKRVLKTP